MNTARHISQSMPKTVGKFDRYATPATIQDLEKWAAESLLKIQESREKQFIKQIENIPAKFRNKTFSDFQIKYEAQEKVKNIAMRYVETFPDRLAEGTSIILQGISYTGKTLLAYIIYQALLRSGFKVRYESSLDFIKSLLEIKFKSQGHYNAEITSLNQYQLLIIDQVTESITKDGKPSEIEKNLLSKIIAERNENNLCTLVITNRDKNEFMTRLGEKTYQALTQKCINLIFNWKPYHQPQN